MTYDLYADVFFLVNFSMDFLVLFLLGKILKIQTTILKLSVGSTVGAAWALVAVVWPVLPPAVEFLMTYVGISSLMVKLSYGTKGVKDTAKAVAGLYLATVSIGGSMYALYQHTRTGYYIEQLKNGNIREALPVCILALLAAGCYFGVRFVWLLLTEEKRRKSHMFSVTLYYRGKQETVIGLIDTGNHLYEPVSKRPVHILTYEACRELCRHISQVQYIPYQSVGTTQGVLPAIYLDSMEIEFEDGKKTIEHPLVAIYKTALSPSGEYQMLLHEEIDSV